MHHSHPKPSSDKLTDQHFVACAGWHPFAAALASCFQPNDTCMSSDSKRVMVLTGPNCSGKSVYLQQVGIIVLLAHIGCFVPASHAEIGLVDRIIARTNQDGARMESFAADLVHLSNVLRLSTDRTLVLIDELGKARNACSRGDAGRLISKP